MHRLSYSTETVFSYKITVSRIVPSFNDSPRKPLRRRPLLSREFDAAELHLTAELLTTTAFSLSYGACKNEQTRNEGTLSNAAK